MINPSSIAFDVDDVFADTVNLFLEIARKDYHLNGIRYEDITSYMVEDCLDIDRQTLEEIFWKIIDGNHSFSLKPLDGAVEVVKRVGRVKTPVLFVTARPNLKSINGWLNDVLALDRDSVEVVATGSFDGKAEVLKEKGISYFVEDRLETCFPLQQAGITPVLFKQPWNRKTHPFIEVGSWKELESLIDFDDMKGEGKD